MATPLELLCAWVSRQVPDQADWLNATIENLSGGAPERDLHIALGLAQRKLGRGDLDLSMPSMRCVGYRQVWQYLDGELSRGQMIEKALAATRQLAKRQITWLRRQSGCEPYNCLNYRKDAIFRQIEAAFPGL